MKVTHRRGALVPGHEKIKVSKKGCWLWTGRVGSSGYASVTRDGRKQSAHVYVWVLENGPVPKGKQVDHTCRSKRCIRGEHLQLTTPSANTKLHYERLGTCRSGKHAKVIGDRRCKQCSRDTQKRYYERTRA